MDTAIADAIQHLMPSFKTWTSYESMKNGQYFSLSQENPVTFSHQISENKLNLYQDATYLDMIGTWIIYLYLVFPEKLNEDLARDQLQSALQDRTVVVLFRDELIDALHEYNNLHRTSINEVKVPKKIIKKIIETVNIELLAGRHRQMRELLRREIRGLLDIAKALPGVIPVKLPLMMAALALSRYEIYWVFTHMSLKESKHSLKAEAIAAPYLPDLMFHCHKLLETIVMNADLIKMYYEEQLVLDIKDIIPFSHEMRKLGKIEISVLDFLDMVIATISNKNEIAKCSVGKSRALENLRLNWYRTSSEMSKEPSVFHKIEGQTIAKLVNPVIDHTRYFDRLEKEVDMRGSMVSLWFYRKYMAQIFNNYCLGKVDMAVDQSSSKNKNKNVQQPTSYRQGRYWIVFLQVFAQALHNVHRQYPQELGFIGVASLQKAEAYINGTTSRIEVCLRNVLGQLSKWSNQTQPETVAEHLIANRGQKTAWQKLPGYESFYPNRQYLANLKYNLDIIGDMCSAFAEVDSLLIHNQRIFPASYLHQLMHDFFYQEMRLLVQETSKTMVRPTRFISRLERLFRATTRIGDYINLDLERMVKQVLYADFYDDRVGVAGGALGMPRLAENSIGKQNVMKKLIHDIRDWYVGIVDSRCAAYESGAVFSPILNGFYDTRSHSSPLEDYCSISELECLCQLIGPSGVRVLDIEIVKIGHAAMQKILVVLRKNKELLDRVDMYKFYAEDRWQAITKRFNGLDVISQQGVAIGSVILFRKLLREALHNVIRRQCTFYSSTMSKIHDKLFRDRIYFESLCHLGLDVGIVSDFTDNVMRNVFYQLANDDPKIWSYIPLVFGICFANSFWTSSKVEYDIKLGALTNNGFALANCVSTLISIFTEQSAHRKNKLLFLDIAGRTLLFLKKQNANHDSINLLFLFLDYFIEICHDLTPMDLQSFSVPYDVVRAQLVKIYGDASGYAVQDSNVMSAGDEDEPNVDENTN